MRRSHPSSSQGPALRSRQLEPPAQPSRECPENPIIPPALPEYGPDDVAPPAPVRGTRERVRIVCRVGGQVALLCLLYAAGTLLAAVSHLPIPGNLVGLLLLLLLLETGIVHCSTTLTEVAAFALRHMGLLFVPFIVGIMAWPSLIATSGFVLAISLIGSAMIGIVAAGLAARYVAGRHV